MAVNSADDIYNNDVGLVSVFQNGVPRRIYEPKR
jgi:hypothetical protein